MRTNDLAPLFTNPNPGKGVTFRQGVIVTWNQETAANTVLVGDTLLTNLPILNSTEAAILAAGHVVGILTFGSTWAILGRFTIPGTPEAVSALSSLRTQSATVTPIESFTSTTYAAATTNPGPELTISVGPTGRLLIFITAEISGQASDVANATSIPGGVMSFALSGANTLAANNARALLVSGNVLVNSSAATLGVTNASTRMVLLEGLTPGATTVTAMYARVGDGTQVNINNRNLTAIAI